MCRLQRGAHGLRDHVRDTSARGRAGASGSTPQRLCTHRRDRGAPERPPALHPRFAGPAALGGRHGRPARRPGRAPGGPRTAGCPAACRYAHRVTPGPSPAQVVTGLSASRDGDAVMYALAGEGSEGGIFRMTMGTPQPMKVLAPDSGLPLNGASRLLDGATDLLGRATSGPTPHG